MLRLKLFVRIGPTPVSKGDLMKTIRRTAFAFALVLSATACGTASITAPNTDSTTNGAYTPGPDSYTPGPDSYTPGPDSYTPGPDSYTPGPDSYTPGPDSSTPGTNS